LFDIYHSFPSPTQILIFALVAVLFVLFPNSFFHLKNKKILEQKMICCGTKHVDEIGPVELARFLLPEVNLFGAIAEHLLFR